MSRIKTKRVILNEVIWLFFFFFPFHGLVKIILSIRFMKQYVGREYSKNHIT